MYTCYYSTWKAAILAVQKHLRVEKIICKMSAYHIHVISIGPAKPGWTVWIVENQGPVGPYTLALDCHIGCPTLVTNTWVKLIDNSKDMTATLGQLGP